MDAVFAAGSVLRMLSITCAFEWTAGAGKKKRVRRGRASLNVGFEKNGPVSSERPPVSIRNPAAPKYVSLTSVGVALDFMADAHLMHGDCWLGADSEKTATANTPI